MSEELIRVAILWHELWHEGLEEASRLYFGERNVKGMFATLEPLHTMMERGPQTLKETSFNQVNLLIYTLASPHECMTKTCQLFIITFVSFKPLLHMLFLDHDIIFFF